MTVKTSNWLFENLVIAQAVLDTTRKRAGRNFRSGSFSSDRRRANISARGKWCGNNVGGSLAFDGERILE